MKTRLARLILAVVAAALIAVPVAGAAGGLVQIDGKLVPPEQVSATQVAAGHDKSTGLVQIGGTLVEPSQLSAWQSGSGQSSATTVASDGPTVDTAAIAVAVAGALVLLASTTLVVRRRRALAAT